MIDAPDFPPLLTGHAVAPPVDPLLKACRRAASGRAGAGDVFWGQSRDDLDVAIVLEPEVGVGQAREMLFLAMVALGDCIGALSPPEVGIFYRWPGMILANGAEVGQARLAMAESDDGAAPPQWLVVGVTLAIRPARDAPDPGANIDRTTLWDEGCGALDRNTLLESYSRHLKTWLHNWETGGVQPVREAWLARAEGRGETVTIAYDGTKKTGVFLGIDEAGGLILKTGETTTMLDLSKALAAGGSPQDC
jgi:biotin-(acetyl-CoA carboxylase) ligase